MMATRNGDSTSKRCITQSKVLTKLPRSAFSFPKLDKKDKTVEAQKRFPVEEAMGLDLSDLSAEGLDRDALEPFKQLRRLSLKKNNLAGIPQLPTTLTYLDLSSNQELCDLTGLSSLAVLTTLILSDCVQLGRVTNQIGEYLKDCTSLKVLVLDHCGLEGELNLKKTSFIAQLQTLIVSHNNLESINLKGATSLQKLSASSNIGLREIKHMASSCDKIAEIRLAHCPKLNNLGFLSKRQRKLAFVDLSFCPLVQDWCLLSESLSVDSLLTLSLKGTPLREASASQVEYQRACLTNLKFKKLRTLDFAPVTVDFKTAKVEVEDGDDSDQDGEDFHALLSKNDEPESEDEDSNVKSAEPVKSIKTEAAPSNTQEEMHQFESIPKRARIKDDEDLFQGRNSAW